MWDQPHLFLFGKYLFTVSVPTIIEHAIVLFDPLSGDMMWGVHGPGGEVHEERFVRCDLFGVGDEADRLVDQVFGQVIAFDR
ncbi:MAG: hypothetical protein PVF74_08495 [Anaerolineales bacterium]|jgi:hypothetical protein